MAGINLIDVFLVKDNQITKTYKLGNLREHNKRENDFRTSYFDIELQPLQKIEIFIKQKTYGTMEIRWNIINIKDFEAYYFLHSKEQTKEYLSYAKKYKLLVTAGSDFHGSIKPEIKLGMNVPRVHLMPFVEALKK